MGKQFKVSYSPKGLSETGDFVEKAFAFGAKYILGNRGGSSGLTAVFISEIGADALVEEFPKARKE